MVVHYVKLLTEYTRAPSAPQFVGRQREMKSLWNQYKAAKGGSARVALLVGELGVGKTRLLDEFAVRAKKDGATVLRGGTSESEGMPPYLPFLEALGQHIRETPLSTLSEQIAVAPQILASILPELTIRLGEVPEIYPLLPEQTRLRLYEAIGMFLEAVSLPRVLVLALDDLHWADFSTLDLLCYITRHHTKTKLLVVGAYREGEIDGNSALERAITELAHQRILTKIVVDPLSAEESEKLAMSYLEGSISPALSQLLYTQSEGNPFFAEELIQNWIEMGALVQEDERWIAVEPFEHTLPESIVGALRQRFARLSSEIIDHLRVAAIIGRSFDLLLLARVEGQGVEAIEERLLEAEHARLVRTDQTGLFRFSHDKIRECLYTEVSTSRRQRLHEAIGQELEARYEKEKTRSIFQLAELAFHFTHSGDSIRGATYSQLAAEQALRSSANKEAMLHYQMALKLLNPGDKRRGVLLSGLGKSALLAGAVSEAIEAYDAAFTWFLQAGDQKAAAQAVYSLGLARWRQGDFQAARTALEHALAILGNNSSVEIVRVLLDLSILLTADIREYAEGKIYAQRAMVMVPLLKDRSLEVATKRVVAVSGCVLGNDLSTAFHALEHTLVLAETDNDACQAVECCFYLMIIHYWMAEISDSDAVSLRCIEFVKHCQEQYQLPYVSSWRAMLFASQGVWVEAEQVIGQALTFMDNQANPIALAFLHQIRGFLAYQQEDYVTAEQEFQVAGANGPGGLIDYTTMLGMTQIALGRCEDASIQQVELEGLLARLPPGSVATAPIITYLALMALALDDQERVVELYPRLLPFLGQHYGFLVDRVLGEMATLRCDWEMANIHLSAAEAMAQRNGLRPELARTLVRKANLEITRGGQGSGIRARDLLNRSLVLFEGLNMPHSIGHVRSRLRPLLRGLDAPPALRTLPADLTLREANVLRLVVEGKSNRQIAHELGISEKTVANHLSHIFNKTASENRAAAAAFAIRHKLA